MKMNLDQIKCVAEDLEYLKSDWGPDIPDPNIRRGSAVLRRLLVENAYGHAWRSAGFDRQPKVFAVNLDCRINKNDHDLVVLLRAGGANFRGITWGSISLIKRAKPPRVMLPLSEGVDIYKAGIPGAKEYYLSDYMESFSGVADGKSVKRREVIKYIANVKGGVHLGPKRRPEEKKLIKKMEKFENKLIIHETDGLLVELVSIAQAIGMSEDAKKLIKYAQK